MEQVVLVDENDNEVGTEEKISAHLNGGKLHRAISVLVFNSKKELLLQQRALNKYHCGGLWANTCCTHPRPGEKVLDAANRRLKEEMGFNTELKEIFHFIYKADFNNGLTEWEFDHVFMGYYDGEVNPNPEEVNDYKWIRIDKLKRDMNENPEKYAPWFRVLFKKFLDLKISF